MQLYLIQTIINSEGDMRDNTNIPIYQVIEKDLRVAILEGKLKQGDMIPSETELCAKYNVTRMTVRQAINNLLVDGYIYRHKGRGTFVTFNKKEMLQDRPSFSCYIVRVFSPVIVTLSIEWLRDEAFQFAFL